MGIVRLTTAVWASPSRHERMLGSRQIRTLYSDPRRGDRQDPSKRVRNGGAVRLAMPSQVEPQLREAPTFRGQTAAMIRVIDINPVVDAVNAWPLLLAIGLHDAAVGITLREATRVGLPQEGVDLRLLLVGVLQLSYKSDVGCLKDRVARLDDRRDPAFVFRPHGGTLPVSRR